MEDLKSFCSKLFDQDGVGAIKDSPGASIPYSRECLTEPKAFITEHPFKKRSVEIWFFKQVKPIVMGRLIFVCQAHNKETFKPSINHAKEKDYLLGKMDAVDAFLGSHLNLYQYYKDGFDTLDTKFFIPEVENYGDPDQNNPKE